MKSKYYQSVLLMIMSAIGFSVIQALVRYLGAGAGSWTKAFYRSFFGLVFLVVWITVFKKKLKFDKKPVLVLRGTAGGVALALSFLCIDIYNLSHATFYLYTFPIFAPVFASVFFRERFRPLFVLPLALSFAGVWMLTAVNNFSFDWKDIIGLASGVSAGVAISTLNELRKTNNAETIYFSFVVFSALICLSGVLFFKENLFFFNPESGFNRLSVWIILVLIGFIATLSQVFMTHSFKNLSTVGGSILSLLTMPLSVGYAVLIFNEHLNPLSFAGGLLIFISAGLITLMGKEKGKDIIPPCSF